MADGRLRAEAETEFRLRPRSESLCLASNSTSRRRRRRSPPPHRASSSSPAASSRLRNSAVVDSDSASKRKSDEDVDFIILRRLKKLRVSSSSTSACLKRPRTRQRLHKDFRARIKTLAASDSDSVSAINHHKGVLRPSKLTLAVESLSKAENALTSSAANQRNRHLSDSMTTPTHQQAPEQIDVNVNGAFGFHGSTQSLPQDFCQVEDISNGFKRKLAIDAESFVVLQRKPQAVKSVSVEEKSPVEDEEDAKTSQKQRLGSCAQEARHEQDVSVDDLAGYLEDSIIFPKKMSYMAEMMYT